MEKLYADSIITKIFLTILVFGAAVVASNAQVNSWNGSKNTDWNTKQNWSLNTVPAATDSVVIGNQSITNYPILAAGSPVSIKSLTIGANTTGKLTLNSSITLTGHLTIATTGTLTMAANTTVTVAGNWNSSGTFTGTSPYTVIFNGVSQTIGGSAPKFDRLTINAGSYVTLKANVVVNTATVVNGTWDTNESPSYLISGSTSFTIGATGTVRIKSATAPECFQFTGGPTLIAGCTVDYASTTVTQTVYSNFAYDNLRISGSGIKQLSGNYASWQTAAADVGNVYVASGTLDLFSYSLSRGSTGGTLTVADGATLRIGGTNSLPSFLNYVFGTTSTVEYYGSTQTISPATYGNLTLTGSSSASFAIAGGKTVNCGNNFLISGGTFNVSNSAGVSTLTATGTFSQTGGTVNVTNSTGTGVVNINTDVNISGGTFNLVANASSPSTIVNINGDLIISGTGKVNLETVSSSAVATINVNGDFNSTGTSVANSTGTGGVIDFGVGSISSNAININGNFIKSGVGTFGSTATTAAKGFVFNGTTPQVFNYSGANSAGIQYTVNAGATLKMASGLALPAGTTPACSFTVNGTIDLGANVITSMTNPTFTVNAAAKVVTASSTGLSGNFSGTFASRTFATGVLYEFNAAVNQSFGFTGMSIPSPKAIIISNTAGAVTPDGNITFTNGGTLLINSGAKLNAGTTTFTFAAGGSVNVIGTLQTSNTGGLSGTSTTTIVNTNSPVITLASTSTVEYTGTGTQNITALNYANLASSSTGARVLPASGSVGISAAFTPGTNSYTYAGSTVIFNGTTLQSVPAFTFHNMLCSNLAGLSLAGAVRIINSLGFGNVNNSTITTNGLLTMASSATTTANLLDITNSASNTGNSISGVVTVERYFTGRRAYRFITAPVNSTTSIKANWMESANNTIIGTNNNPVPGYGTQITGAGGSSNGFDVTNTNNPSLFTFNLSSQGWNAVSNTAGLFTAGNGYRMMVRGSRSVDLTNNDAVPSATTLRASGTLMTGDVKFTAAGAGGTAGTPALSTVVGAYSFIANPYASDVNFDTLAKTDVASSIYVFDPTIAGSGGRGGYVVYNTEQRTNNNVNSQVNNHIQSGQAFFVQTTGPNPSITFKENYKSTTNRAVFRTGSDQPTLSVQLVLASQFATSQAADAIRVQFSNDYSPAIANEDSYKFTNLDENLAIIRNGQSLAIEGRKPVAGSDTVALKLWQLSQPGYGLRISLSNFASNVTAYLEDSYLKTSTPLNNNADTLVAFNITSDAASINPGRFRIIFTSLTTLPVQLSTITAQEKTGGVEVSWTVATETDVDRYEVEHSANAQQFALAGTVAAKNGGTASTAYGFFDPNPFAGDTYYRVKSVTKAGEVKYSDVARVRMHTPAKAITANAIPASGVFTLHFNNAKPQQYDVFLIDASGRKLYEGAVNYGGGVADVRVNTAKILSFGVYHIQVKSRDTLTNFPVLF